MEVVPFSRPRKTIVELVRDHPAAYAKSWVQMLKDDPKEILRASRDADKIQGTGKTS